MGNRLLIIGGQQTPLSYVHHSPTFFSECPPSGQTHQKEIFSFAFSNLLFGCFKNNQETAQQKAFYFSSNKAVDEDTDSIWSGPTPFFSLLQSSWHVLSSPF